MISPSRRIRVVSFALLTLAAVVIGAGLTGCGLGSPVELAPSVRTSSPFSGTVYGGANPIIGATVKIYETGSSTGTNSGYGVGHFLQEANTATGLSAGQDTDANGAFTFAGGYSCHTGQFLYLTSGAGNTGNSTPNGSGATATANIDGNGVITSITVNAAGSGYFGASVSIADSTGPGAGATATATVSGGGVSSVNVTNGGTGYVTPVVTITGSSINNAALMVAALGRCEDLIVGNTWVGGNININELSTIAAAYALGGFSSVSYGTTGDASTAVVSIGAPDTANSLYTVGGYSTGCVAGQPVGCTTTATAGLYHAFLNAASLLDVYKTEGARSTLNNNSTAIVPRELINSLGNSLIACVNSNGTGTACANIFGCTNTPAVSANGNSYTAMVNLARNPTCAGGTKTVTDIFNTASAQTNFFIPNLGSFGPADWEIAIVYPKGAAGSPQGMIYPYSETLDINDNLYVGNESVNGNATVNLLSFTSNGSFAASANLSGTTNNAFGVKADGIGNVYLLNSNLSTVVKFPVTTATGAIGTPGTPVATSGKPYDAAVDRANNLWYSTLATTVANLFELPAGSSTPAGYLLTSPTLNNGVAVDPFQNIWTTNYSTTVGADFVTVLTNNAATTAAAPTYTANTGFVKSSALNGGTIYNVTFVDNSVSATQPFNAFYGAIGASGKGLSPIAPTKGTTAPALVSVTPGSLVGTPSGSQFGSPRYPGSDSDKNIYIPDNSGGVGLMEYNPSISATTYQTLAPCKYFSSVSTSCGAINGANAAIDNARQAVVDSTGSVWVVSSTNGQIVQIIGLAAPSWPLLSLGVLTKP